MSTERQPTLFLPHGGGPCFFMDDPNHIWTGMADFLRSVPGSLPNLPTSILVISGHWERDIFAFTGADTPSLIYDYSGFPKHTYELRYDVPGSPSLAARAASLLGASGIKAEIDTHRGLDHGVFIPLKVAFPDATIPLVQMSLRHGLDPKIHLEAGRALAPLRDEGVLIIGSGMSYHNMRGYGDPRSLRPSEQFDTWLTESVLLDGNKRREQLSVWETAPAARASHPHAEHLLPLMVAAGASDGPGHKIYSETVLGVVISGFRFD